jgi:hypothetical protein
MVQSPFESSCAVNHFGYAILVLSQPAQVRVRQQPDLFAAQFQDGAILVGQHDRARASPDRKARACRTIDARNIRRPPDLGDPA